MNIENYRKVFYDKTLTLPNSMRLLGMSEEIIDDTMSWLKKTDIHGAFGYQARSMEMKMMAYEYLLQAGEIQADKIYNLNFLDTDAEGDLGLKNGRIMRFSNGEWI